MTGHRKHWIARKNRASRRNAPRWQLEPAGFWKHLRRKYRR